MKPGSLKKIGQLNRLINIRAGNPLWLYRKELISLLYLFMVGMGFGAIWLFYTGNFQHQSATKNSLAFEENHKIVEVVIAEIDQKKEDQTISSLPAGKDSLPLLSQKGDTKSETAALKRQAPWQLNAVKVAGTIDDMPQISIVIDDLGVVRGKTAEIINLPAPLTLSFLPYAPHLPDLTQNAALKGHELMIHLPMEPKGDKDPGPHALLTGTSRAEMLQDLHFNLNQFTGYVGFNNHMGSAFTENESALDVIMAEIEKKGLLVLDSRTSGRSLLAKVATRRNIPNVTRDFFLDNEQDRDYILAQLAKLEKLAVKNGSAIAIGHPYAETIWALKKWMPTLKDKGIALVPLSHIVQTKYAKIQLAGKDSSSPSAH